MSNWPCILLTTSEDKLTISVVVFTDSVVLTREDCTEILTSISTLLKRCARDLANYTIDTFCLSLDITARDDWIYDQYRFPFLNELTVNGGQLLRFMYIVGGRKNVFYAKALAASTYYPKCAFLVVKFVRGKYGIL